MLCLVTQSCLTLCDPIACQAPLSVGFSRQEHWSGFPCPPPGDLPNPGIKLRSPALQAESLPSEPPGKPNIQATSRYISKRLAYLSLPKDLYETGSRSFIYNELKLEIIQITIQSRLNK